MAVVGAVELVAGVVETVVTGDDTSTRPFTKDASLYSVPFSLALVGCLRPVRCSDQNFVLCMTLVVQEKQIKMN